ncbi:MAG: hypothetical protein UX21_C0041G0009, partial [Microgenomates group bacterium GW2011_GWC2_45_8]
MVKISKEHFSDSLHAVFLPLSLSSLDLSRLQSEIFFVLAEAVEEDGEEERDANQGANREGVGGPGDTET